MKNIITFNEGGFLTLENIDSGADSIIIRYCLPAPNNPKISVDGTEYSLTNSGDHMYTYTISFSGITQANYYIDFNLVNGGTSYTSYRIAFYDFDADGNFHANLWQKRLQVFTTGNAYVFHAYIIALVETETTTIGDGLTVTDRAELKVNAGAGLTTTPDGKVAAIQALKNVDTIDVTESGDLISSITINYDDETSNTYACSYDANDNLISFGGVTINWE